MDKDKKIAEEKLEKVAGGSNYHVIGGAGHTPKKQKNEVSSIDWEYNSSPDIIKGETKP